VIDSATLKARFPEFDDADDTLTDAKLDDAQAVLSRDAFVSADLHERAVFYLAAHLLGISPFGTQLQLRNDDGRTTYGDYFDAHILPLIARRGLISGGA
jgi:hypothetical protein